MPAAAPASAATWTWHAPWTISGVGSPPNPTTPSRSGGTTGAVEVRSIPSISWTSESTLEPIAARSGPSSRQSTSHSPIATTERRVVADPASWFVTGTIEPGRTRR